MDIELQPIDAMVGTAPTTVVKRGGTLPDGTIVHSAEDPALRADSRYLAFFYDSNLVPHHRGSDRLKAG